MNQFSTKNAYIKKLDRGYLLGIQKEVSLRYRDAQLDDYSGLPRAKFPHPSLTLKLAARASAESTPGTWGFGVWNDPFGLSLGFGGTPFRLPALPNAAWFFYASPENYLSFRGNLRAACTSATGTGERSRSAIPSFDFAQDELPANGFIAQTFRSPKFHPLLMLAGLTFPFSRKKSRSYLSKVIAEDSKQLWSLTARRRDMKEQAPRLHDIDVTQWHNYKLQWSPARVVWYVDDVQAFESLVSPNPPLGIIIWIDNQFASFTPDGKISGGVLPNEDSWLEVRDIEMTSGG